MAELRVRNPDLAAALAAGGLGAESEAARRMAAKDQKNLIYKIYYGDMLAYVGRTRQRISQRLHGHFFGKPKMRKLDVFLVSRVEVAECSSQADMFLYEIYYINRDKPPCNCDDKAPDILTATLPELSWKEVDVDLLDKWREEIKSRDATFEGRRVVAATAWEHMMAVRKEARKEAGGCFDHPLWDAYDKAREVWEAATKAAEIW